MQLGKYIGWHTLATFAAWSHYLLLMKAFSTAYAMTTFMVSLLSGIAAVEVPLSYCECDTTLARGLAAGSRPRSRTPIDHEHWRL
jgi:hypothetical protein